METVLSPFKTIDRILLIAIVVYSLAGRLPVLADTSSSPPKSLPVTIIPQDGFNLVLVNQIENRLILKLASPAHNWFACQLARLSVGRDLVVGFSLAENDTERNHADVSKWIGLVPLLSYADPASPTAYEYFTKDDKGRWVSSDFTKQNESRFAGSGLLPDQQAVPANLAQQFLSPDGVWIPWKEVDSAECVPNLNIFRITQRFDSTKATLSMRYPYTYNYEQAFVSKLQQAKLPGVSVDELGLTPGGRKLQVIRLDPADAKVAEKLDRPTILVYALEHATEKDSGHGVEGMLRWLLSDNAEAKASRVSTTWLFIPILDPDASADAIVKTGDFFIPVDPAMPEALLYAKYIIKRLDAGGRLDIVVNLHNVECNEQNNLSSPFINFDRQDRVIAFNTKVFSTVKNAGYTVGDPAAGQRSSVKARLSGWCAHRFAAQDIVFELNSRAPASPLNLPRLQQLGELLARELAAYVHDPAFSATRDEISKRLTERTIQAKTWWTKVKRTPDTAIPYDTFMGY